MGRHECKKSNKHLELTMIMMVGSKYMSRAVAFENSSKYHAVIHISLYTNY